MFAAGDCADAHGAIQAGHTAAGQAEVAAANVVKLVKQEEGEEKVEFDKCQSFPSAFSAFFSLAAPLFLSSTFSFFYCGHPF